MDVSFILAVSIIVTVVVRPSKFLDVLLCSMCLCVALVGIAIAFVWVGDLSLPFRMSIAAACILASTAFFSAKYHRKTYQISISGDGQIRLSEYGAVLNRKGCSGFDDISDEVLLVSLQDNSIIWPQLLLLRLKGDNKKTFNVPILADSLSVSDFRSLSVACRWIATHNKSVEKIT